MAVSSTKSKQRNLVFGILFLVTSWYNETNISAENEEEGDEFEFEIEFESDPKPDKITWFMQDAVGRRETVKEASTVVIT